MIPNPLNPRGYIAYLALAALLVLPLATQSPFVMHLAIQVCVFAALASAWNIVGGWFGYNLAKHISRLTVKTSIRLI